jgi:signal recognition particle subunit SEC65
MQIKLSNPKAMKMSEALGISSERLEEIEEIYKELSFEFFMTNDKNTPNFLLCQIIDKMETFEESLFCAFIFREALEQFFKLFVKVATHELVHYAKHEFLNSILHKN